MKLAILLTATINVFCKQGYFTALERYRMYRETLIYYANSFGKRYPIVFIDNSDYDLSSLEYEFKDKLIIEFIQFPPVKHNELGFCSKRGKGYNEYLMLSLALQKSQILKQCTYFFKITGRYPLLNINDFINEICHRKAKFVFVCDIKDTKIFDLIYKNKDKGHYGESRYWVAECNFYREHLAGIYQMMNDNNIDSYAEQILLQVGRKYKSDSRFVYHFATPPHFGGCSGHLINNKIVFYQNTNYIKRILMKFVRKYIPWLLYIN